jgi:hypothetical protein
VSDDEEIIRLPELARVHESTVKDAEKHAASHRKRRRPNRPRPRVVKYEATISDEVMETARTLVGPDQHLRITSTGEVFILNGKNMRDADDDVIMPRPRVDA